MPSPDRFRPDVRALFAAVGLALLLPQAGRADGSPAPVTVVITQQEGRTVPDDAVTCAGTVHGYLTFPRAVVGLHILSSVWVRPDGDAQDNADVKLDFPPPGRRTAEVWLRFNDRSDGALAAVEGDENHAFNGEWRLSLRLDGRPIADQKFRVKC